MSEEEKRICLGAFAGAQGVKGEALVKTFTETPERIAAYGPVETEDGARRFTLTFIRETKPGLALVRSAEIASREDAQALKGVRLYIDRAALPEPDENEFYMDDLVGLEAFDKGGGAAGRVSAVYNFGAGDMLELTGIPGVKGARVIEFTRENFPELSLEEGRIIIRRNALNEEEDELA